MLVALRWTLLLIFVAAALYFGSWTIQSASFSVNADAYMHQIYATRAMLSFAVAILCIAVGVLFFICLRKPR